MNGGGRDQGPDIQTESGILGPVCVGCGLDDPSSLWLGNLRMQLLSTELRVCETDKLVGEGGTQSRGHMQKGKENPTAFSTPKGPSNKKGRRQVLRRQSGAAADSLVFYTKSECVQLQRTLYRSHSGSPGPGGWPCPFFSDQTTARQRAHTGSHGGFILVSNMISRDTGNSDRCITLNIPEAKALGQVPFAAQQRITQQLSRN